MYSFFLPLLMGAPQGGGDGGPMSFVTSLIPFAAIIAIFYFLIIRPQNKKQKETQRMLDSIKKGDKVVTIGGIHGTVQKVNAGDKTVILKIDDNVSVKFSRTAVSSVVTVADDDDEDDPKGGGKKIADKKAKDEADKSADSDDKTVNLEKSGDTKTE